MPSPQYSNRLHNLMWKPPMRAGREDAPRAVALLVSGLNRAVALAVDRKRELQR